MMQILSAWLLPSIRNNTLNNSNLYFSKSRQVHTWPVFQKQITYFNKLYAYSKNSGNFQMPYHETHDCEGAVRLPIVKYSCA